MDLFKKAIYLDLQTHFQRKIHHDQLFNCLIYDFLLAQLVIGPLYIFTWRGTWQNADALFDQQIFSGNLYMSTLCVLCLGTMVSASLTFTQYKIKAWALNGSQPRFFLISRLFTVMGFYSDLLIWKGIWGFFDYIVYRRVNGTWVTSLCTSIISTLILFMLRSVKSSIGSPMGMGIDRRKLYVSVSTFLSTTTDDSYSRRIQDVLITIPVSFVSIAVFYGYWSGMDHLFEVLGISIEMNSTFCTVSYDKYDRYVNQSRYFQIFGFVCGLLVFVGQFVFVWWYYKHKVTEENNSLKKFPKLLRLLAYDVLLLISLIGSVASFRGIWNLTDLYFIADNPVASRFVSQLMGLMYLFLFYSGTSLHGGVVRDNQTVMVPNFFLTYLLSNKEIKTGF